MCSLLLLLLLLLLAFAIYVVYVVPRAFKVGTWEEDHLFEFRFNEISAEGVTLRRTQRVPHFGTGTLFLPLLIVVIPRVVHDTSRAALFMRACD